MNIMTGMAITRGLFLILVAFTLSMCGGQSAGSGDKTVSTPAKSTESTASKAEEVVINKKGQLVFKQYCVVCHGADGKLAVSGATDLSASTLSMTDRIEQITNGKGLMTPYKDILSKEQIEAVADYITVLIK